MSGKNVLISGASVAGPALAYWLGHYGFRPTVVEVAPAPREGGYAVDFRGEVHLSVLERMGVLEQIRAQQTGGIPIRFVDERDRVRLELPIEFAGGAVEIRRSDLSTILREHSANTTEYVFGDSISELTDTGSDTGGVHVVFESGTERTFDLVIGADGLHSNVRKLAFGPEERFVSHLGYYVAGWEMPAPSWLGTAAVGLNRPGKYASAAIDHLNPAMAGAYVLFESPELEYHRRDADQQKRLIAEHLAGMGWRVPEILDTLPAAEQLYFDSISRVDVPNWSTGRIGLIGDAACGATLGGMGTGTAIVAAYVLAGELARADHRTAFTRYENLLRDFATECQKGGDRTGRFLAPGSAFAIWLRNKALSNKLLLKLMLKAGEDLSSNVSLPDYRYESAAR
ncbi:FAD-dependent monooxygenase [Amycolatopsis sp. YIM 10]|uniref:FAD-dependent monooxygenase n=1 Tax=Amycolatopsis sp. YIM 10 TaxID=2653857 RepID=UPI00128FE6F4|nr:FAD-dependent monooxygenase [Amycolatopsis sp. YIM 10]QFU94611.1 6-hydroxynicotinate 3-monooxygenase precursor [Amycolatopsis sp. YIM 10]